MKIKVEAQRADSARSDCVAIGIGRNLFRYAFLTGDYVQGRLRNSLGLKRRSGCHLQGDKDTNEVHEGKTRMRSQSQDRRQIGLREYVMSERGDVPGWVLVVLMTTGLVTAIWAVAAPKLNAILKNSLDSMNNIR